MTQDYARTFLIYAAFNLNSSSFQLSDQLPWPCPEEPPHFPDSSAQFVKNIPERFAWASFPTNGKMPEKSSELHCIASSSSRFQYFYPKTGVTGPYVFGAGLTTYLCSKEIYVMEHEYYSGLSILIMVVYATKKFGPKVAAYLDKEVDVSWGM